MNRGTFLKNTFFVLAAGSVTSINPFNIAGSFTSQKQLYERLFSNLKNGFILERYAEELGTAFLSGQETRMIQNISAPGLHFDKSLQKMISNQGFSAHQTIQKLIQRDFEINNTVRLKGWILSETEARLCALYKLTI